MLNKTKQCLSLTVLHNTITSSSRLSICSGSFGYSNSINSWLNTALFVPRLNLTSHCSMPLNSCLTTPQESLCVCCGQTDSSTDFPTCTCQKKENKWGLECCDRAQCLPVQLSFGVHGKGRHLGYARMRDKGVSLALGKQMKCWRDMVYGHVRSQPRCQQLASVRKLGGIYVLLASSTKTV